MNTHTKHKLVKTILTEVARDEGQKFTQIRRLFYRGKADNITMMFWEKLKHKYPKHGFTDVSYCSDCRKFDLE